MEQTARLNEGIQPIESDFDRQLYEKFFSRYYALGYKGVNLKGYLKNFNPTGDYNVGKEPITKGYTGQGYRSPTVQSLVDHVQKGGEVGWLVAPGRIVVDSEDKYAIQKIDQSCNGLKPPSEITKHGNHWTFSTSEDVTGGTKVYTRLGVPVTYKLAGKGYVIQTPSRGNRWINEDALDNPPPFPDWLLEHRKDNEQDLLNCIAWEVHRLKSSDAWGKYEDMLSLSVFLCQIGIDNDKIHEFFKIVYQESYDQKKVDYFLKRNTDRLDNNEPLIGSGTFFQSLQNKELDILKSFALSLERLKGKGKQKEESSLQEQIKKLPKSPPYDSVKDILKKISKEEPLQRSMLISALAEKTKISKRQLQTEVERYSTENLELDDNTVIIHPAYDIQGPFINLGFKITQVRDDIPVSQNVYIRNDGGEYQLRTGAVFEVNGRKGVYDLRDRDLLPLSAKWDIDQLKLFVENPTSPNGLYNSIKDALSMFIEFADPAVYGLAAAWIIGTYFHRLFQAYPFLFIYGLKGTGKSRFEDVLEQLCMAAYKTRSVSVASLADTLDGTRGTFILDQAEILSHKNYADLLGILADSYTVGGGRRRIVVISSSGVRRVVEFETYGPKCFASTKDIDADLRDRCIEIVMVKANKEYPDPEKTLPLWAYLRDQLHRLLLTKWQEVRGLYPQAGLDMIQRVRQLWKPLDTILMLENVDDDERASIKEYFLRSVDKTQAKVSDLQEQLVRAIWGLLGDSEQKDLTASEITEKMALPETEKFTKVKQAQWVGSVIRKLDLYNEKLKRDKDRRPYKFTRDKVADIARRFGISLEEGDSGEFIHEDEEVIQGELL